MLANANTCWMFISSRKVMFETPVLRAELRSSLKYKETFVTASQVLRAELRSSLKYKETFVLASQVLDHGYK